VPVEGTCGSGMGDSTGPFEPEPYNPNTLAYGQPVRTQMAQPGRLHLDVRHLPAGLYFLELRDATGKTVRKQIRIAR